MTAILAAGAPNGSRGFILADSAMYDELTGVIASHGVKTLPIAHASCAFAASGTVVDVLGFYPAMQCAGSFDELQRDLPRLRGRLPRKYEIDGIIMGWSAALKRVSMFSFSGDGPQAFSPDTVSAWFSPLPGGDLGAFGFNRRPDPRDDGASIPSALLRMAQHLREKHGRGYTEAQAESPTSRTVIGCAAVLTEISRDRITQRVIHRWPDKIGERIASPQPEAA